MTFGCVQSAAFKWLVWHMYVLLVRTSKRYIVFPISWWCSSITVESFPENCRGIIGGTTLLLSDDCEDFTEGFFLATGNVASGIFFDFGSFLVFLRFVEPCILGVELESLGELHISTTSCSSANLAASLAASCLNFNSTSFSRKK